MLPTLVSHLHLFLSRELFSRFLNWWTLAFHFLLGNIHDL